MQAFVSTEDFQTEVEGSGVLVRCQFEVNSFRLQIIFIIEQIDIVGLFKIMLEPIHVHWAVEHDSTSNFAIFDTVNKDIVVDDDFEVCLGLLIGKKGVAVWKQVGDIFVLRQFHIHEKCCIIFGYFELELYRLVVQAENSRSDLYQLQTSVCLLQTGTEEFIKGASHPSHVNLAREVDNAIQNDLRIIKLNRFHSD